MEKAGREGIHNHSSTGGWFLDPTGWNCPRKTPGGAVVGLTLEPPQRCSQHTPVHAGTYWKVSGLFQK